METITKGFAIVMVTRGFCQGELVLHGPKGKRKLDACKIVHIPAHQVISIHDTERAKWN